jgi:hypothetical protein
MKGTRFSTGVEVPAKGERLAASRCFPLWPQQRTSLNRVGMSEKCQKQTHAPQQTQNNSPGVKNGSAGRRRQASL